MKKLLTLALAALLLAGCAGKGQEVPFAEAHNYFVRNDAPEPVPTKITSQEEFEACFGMAAFMGKDGKVTPIDFSKQFVLTVVLPVTETETAIHPLRVEAKGDTLYYSYEIQTGEPITYSIRPASVIILDSRYADKAVLLTPAE